MEDTKETVPSRGKKTGLHLGSHQTVTGRGQVKPDRDPALREMETSPHP